MTAKYEKEKEHITSLKDLKTKLDEARGDLERYEREYDYNKVAEIRYGVIPKIRRRNKARNMRLRKTMKVHY